MKQVRLGRTDLQVSQVGIGGIPLQRPSEMDAVRLVEHALDKGINLIDTSRHYGDSELRIGKGIKDRREEVILITRQGSPDKEQAKKYLQKSLRTLQTDYIDIWQFHNFQDEKYEKLLSDGSAFEIAKEAQKEGKIKFIGLTSHSFDTMQQAIESELFDVVLYPFNFVNNEAADSLVPLARKHDIGFTAMKPFAGGRLQQANLAIKYLLQFENVIPVPGVEREEEIDEIVALASGDYKLTAEETDEIQTVRSELGSKFCQWCGYCMPDCPQEIYIPMVINAKVMYDLWPKEGFVARMKDAVKKSESCISCKECEAHCPYELPILELLAKGTAFYQSVVDSKN